MRLIHAFKYQMTTALKSLGLFYTIILLLSVGVQVVLKRALGSDTTHLAALESNTCLFMLFLGVFSVVEDFKFFLQNGYSRKSMIKLYALQFLACALVGSIADTVIAYAMESYDANYSSLVTQLYGSQSALFQMMWLFVLYLSVSFVSFFLTVLFQRLNKMQRILIMAAIPCAIMVLIPILDMYLMDGKLIEMLGNTLIKLMGLGTQINLVMPLMTFGILAVIFSLLSYAVIRRVAMFTS